MGFRLLLAVLLLAAAAPARAADPVWIQVTSSNFTLFTDTTEIKGRRLLEDLEGRLTSLGQVLGEIPQRQFPVEVFLFSKREEFLETAPKPAGPDAPAEFEKSAYLLRGPDRIFVVARDKAPEDIAEDVGHALGHVFFERFVMWRPFWLAEGAAEYFRKVGRAPDAKRISEKDGYSVADLLEIVESRDYQDDARPTAFRTQAHRLFRLVVAEQGVAFREYLASLRTEEGKDAKLMIEASALQKRFDAYVETRIAPGSGAFNIRLQGPSEAIPVHRGDLLVAAKKTSEAADWYKGDGLEARAGRAILTRFSRSTNEAIRALERAFAELPDSGQLAFHLGSIETKTPADIELQARALERAAELMPRSGRARGQLARVYALAGNGQEALKQVDRALELEPEYADEFYTIRSEAYLALARYGEANRAMQTAVALPHGDASQNYTFKASEMSRRVEQTRRDADNKRLQEIRTEVAARVAEREPPPPPRPPPPPERFGSVEYTLQSTRQTSIVSAPLPVFENALVQKGVAGSITLQVTIGADGKIAQASIAESQIPDMNAATLEAVKKWTFAPVLSTAAGRGTTAFNARIVVRFVVQ
jgi:TonB family protein